MNKKLSKDDIFNIKFSGRTAKDLAETYGVTKGYIYNIRNNAYYNAPLFGVELEEKKSILLKKLLTR